MGSFDSYYSKSLVFMNIKKFQRIIWNHYQMSKRSFPWRETGDPYLILVSEIMLQQTQATRVVVKYNAFIKKFPTLKILAGASIADVLKMWIGLGYNRRALNLKRLAEIVEKDFNGSIPSSLEELLILPGIGPYTAGAVLAFAFNTPRPIIETNIRTVYIHFFFPRKTNGSEQVKVSDKELFPIILKTLDEVNPREWYWALMDYGAMLKQTGQDKNKVSRQYIKQSTFEGSDRQIRGKILKLLCGGIKLSKYKIIKAINDDKNRAETKLAELLQEGFIKKIRSGFTLA